MSSWKYDGRPLRTNSLHRTSLMILRLRNSLTECHVAHSSPCNSLVLGGVPRVTHWNRFFNAGLALCADTSKFNVSESLGVSAATALSEESTESWLACGSSFEGFRNTTISMLVGQNTSWINVWTLFQSSLLRPQPIWGLLMRKTFLLSAWLFIASRDNLNALYVGLWKYRTLVIKW